MRNLHLIYSGLVYIATTLLAPMVNLLNCLPQNNDTVASLVARYARQQQKLMMTIHSVKSLFQNLELPILHLELYMLKWEEAGKEAFLKSH